MVIKYYVYVSHTKVDMLYAQIPRTFLSGLSAELKVNLGLVSSTLKQGPEPETTYARLKAVVKYLEETETIGTIDEPAAYFKGALPMKWGPYETLTGRMDKPSPLVYFGGETEATILGLGGSLQNVVGAPGNAPAHSHSATPALLACLYEGLELPIPESDAEYLRLTRGRNDPKMIAMAVDLATTQMQGVLEEVEFFARRLAYFPKGTHSAWRTQMNILLGTPLYVALGS